MFGRSLADRLLATASASLSADGDDLSLLTNVEAAMVVVDACAEDLPIIFANAAFLDLTGYRLNEVIGRNCRFLQGPQTEPAERERFHVGLASRKPFAVTLINYRKDGTPFRNQVLISPVRDGDDRVTRFIGMQMAMEIGEDVGRSNNEALQLRELRHRFKNHVQAMASLVSLQARRVRAPEAAQALDDLRARFEVLASLYRDMDNDRQGDVALDCFLPSLVERIGQLYDAAGRHRLVCTIADVSIPYNVAATVGQILTELIINVYRHAFAGQDAGSATIRLTAHDGELELTVVDNGPGVARTDAHRGHLGLSIISNLARSLDGTFEHTTGEGFTGRVRFPELPRNGA
jgi:PAS domain S-box-containing protein